MLTKIIFMGGLAAGLAAPTDWEGTWDDNALGGKYHLCVTLVDGTYYGQGLFSKVGYMRGVIDATTDVWTGNWYMSGIESRRGTFSYTLPTTTSYSGTRTETNGEMETLTGNKFATGSPTDLECFKAEPQILSGTESFTFAGDWLVGNVDRYANVDANNLLTGSYDYGEGMSIPGWYYGRVSENGGVAQLQWYDPDHYEGMYLFGAKNKSAQYILWHGADWISDYSFAAMGTGHWADTGFGTRVDLKVSEVDDYNLANKNRCYQLITASFEESCVEQLADGDDDAAAALTLMYPTLVFAAIGMIAALVSCAGGLMGKTGAPMAGSSDAKL